MHSYTITQADPGDIPELIPLLRQLFAIETDFYFDEEKHARAFGLIIADVMCDVAVIRLDGKIIGMATMQPSISTAEGGYVGIIEDVVIDSRHRDKGLGKRIVGYLIGRARLKAFAAVKLLADKTNTPALRFYKSLGFSQTQLLMLRKRISDASALA